jgi:hypothetical protein
LGGAVSFKQNHHPIRAEKQDAAARRRGKDPAHIVVDVHRFASLRIRNRAFGISSQVADEFAGAVQPKQG